MSKNTKRQRKLEDMIGVSSTKKKKGNNDDTSTVDKQNVVNSPSKLFRGRHDKINNNIYDRLVEKTSTVKKISDDDLELLRNFDLDTTFGPCTGEILFEIFFMKYYFIGIPRIDRYERALRHDLNPPPRVLELINLYPNDRQVTHW